MTVIGGGLSAGGATAALYLDLTESYPNASHTGWVISAANWSSGGGGITITGYAICAQ
jgi:hypothetical protein